MFSANLKETDSWLLIGPNYGHGGSLKQESTSIKGPRKSPSEILSDVVASSQVLQHSKQTYLISAFHSY